MAGRRDFAVLYASLFADARAHDAAARYVAAQMAVEDTAVATVAGHVAMLALWAMRETDDGVLPGDGTYAAQVALLCSPASTRLALAALEAAKLLRRTKRGVYLVGFRDCYQRVITKRKEDRDRLRDARKAKAKGRGDVAATSQRHSGDVAEVSLTTVPNPTPPDRAVAGSDQTPAVASDRTATDDDATTAGGSASPPNGERPADPPPLDARELSALRAACAAILGQKDVHPAARSAARRTLDAIKAGTLDGAAADAFREGFVYSRTDARSAYLGERRRAS